MSTFKWRVLAHKLSFIVILLASQRGRISNFRPQLSNASCALLLFPMTAVFNPRDYIYALLSKTSAEDLRIEMVNDDDEDTINMEESYSPKPRSNSIAEPTSASSSAFSHKRNRSETIAALGRFTITQRNSTDILVVTPEAGQEVHTSAPPASREGAYPKSERFVVDPAKSKVRSATFHRKLRAAQRNKILTVCAMRILISVFSG